MFVQLRNFHISSWLIYSYISRRTFPHSFRNINRLNGLVIKRKIASQNIDIGLKKNKLKNVTEEDELLKKLNDSQNPTDVINKFCAFGDSYKSFHMTQSVILLWNFKKNCLESNDELAEITKDKKFESFLDKMNSFVEHMDIEDTSRCLLYLNKLGIENHNKTIVNLLNKALNQLSNETSDVPLSTLARILEAVLTDKNCVPVLVCKDMIPHLIVSLKNCQTADEILSISHCLQNLNELITEDILNIYKNKVKLLIATGKIDHTNTRAILKIVNFLTYPKWSQKNPLLIRDLLILLTNTVDLTSKDLWILIKVYQNQLEPAIFIPKFIERAESIFKIEKTPEALACALQFVQPKDKIVMNDVIRKMMLKEFNLPTCFNTLASFFKILRSSKTADLQLCDIYWSKVVEEIQAIPLKTYLLFKHCHRYMYFNNNLGGTYRHLEFEKVASSLLMNEINNSITGILPSEFVKCASFIIAYGTASDNEFANDQFSDDIINKIESISSQLGVLDCLQLSRGFHIALELRYKYTKYKSYKISAQLVRISNVFHACASRHLKKNDLSLSDLNCIIRTLNNQKFSRESQIYQNAIEKYKIHIKELNSRTLRDVTYNLTASNYLMPEVFDEMFRYITKNRDYVYGDTVEKILTSAFKLGYAPESNESFHWINKIIKRDFEYMTSMSVVQACLALCFYKELSEDLISSVFSKDFIQRVEDEVQTCYSKETYPERVMNQVMQLNRAVCLDFPQLQVPWFEQNYIQAQISKPHPVYTKYRNDIKNLLIHLLPDENHLKCNYTTYYGYQIDFVICFNKNRKPIVLPQQESSLVNRITKIAILLLKLNTSSKNDKWSNISGTELLKTRHLEMLGFDVIHIDINDWNSMYMNIPGVKINFLKSLLQIK